MKREDRINWSRSFIDDKALVYFRNIKTKTLILLIFLMLTISTAPSLLGKMYRTPDGDFPGITLAMMDILETNDCIISEEVLSCTNYSDYTTNTEIAYDVMFFVDIESELESNESFMDKNLIVINANRMVWLNESSNSYKSVNYSQIEDGFEFSSINNVTEGLSEYDSHLLVAMQFTEDLYNSNLLKEVSILFSIQIIQNLMIFVVVVLLFQTLNIGKSDVKRINLGYASRFIAINMLNIFFITSLVAIYKPLVAVIATTFMLVIRNVKTYFYIMNPKIDPYRYDGKDSIMRPKNSSDYL